MPRLRKVTLGIVLLILLLMLSFPTILAASDTIQAALFAAKFKFNGMNTDYGEEYTVLNVNGHAYVPIRFVAENMRGIVGYDDLTKTISVDFPKSSHPNTIVRYEEGIVLHASSDKQFYSMNDNIHIVVHVTNTSDFPVQYVTNYDHVRCFNGIRVNSNLVKKRPLKDESIDDILTGSDCPGLSVERELTPGKTIILEESFIPFTNHLSVGWKGAETGEYKINAEFQFKTLSSSDIQLLAEVPVQIHNPYHFITSKSAEQIVKDDNRIQSQMKTTLESLKASSYLDIVRIEFSSGYWIIHHYFILGSNDSTNRVYEMMVYVDARSGKIASTREVYWK